MASAAGRGGENKKKENKKKQSRSAAGVTLRCAHFKAQPSPKHHRPFYEMGGYWKTAWVSAAIITIAKNATRAATPPDQIRPNLGLKN